MQTRITSSTVLVQWDKRIHTHAVLVYGKNASQSKNYEEYAKKVSSKVWTMDESVRSFWGQGERVPPKVYKYFARNPITTKPKGFENGIRIQFEFGVVKLFDTGKGLLTISLKGIDRESINSTIQGYVRQVHNYIKDISEDDELQWYSTQLNVESFTWNIVSLNSTASIFANAIDLNELYKFSSPLVSTFYDSEYHKGYLQMYIDCGTKKNTICIYHTGKCVIMGVKSLESLQTIEQKLSAICSEFELKQLEDILFQ